MNEVMVKKESKIENMIYEIRGKQVMLDSDLAKLYQCKNGTKSINLAVKRRIIRFPERFMFQLTKEETEYLRFQNETTNYNEKSRTLPYVFTEQGIAMLATILKTPVAEEISIGIMDAFVSMRKYISKDLLKRKYMGDMLLKHDHDIKVLQDTFKEFKTSNNEIFFEGQIYDAYSKIIDIMSKVKEELIIIDAYADKQVLDMISKINVKIILITGKNKLLNQIDIDKYNRQYNNLSVYYDNTFHDRYLILDKETVYHCGSSLNHIGEKTFSINKFEDEEVIGHLVNKIKNNLNSCYNHK